jgi:Domain of unknown function (DUF4192)
LSRGLRGHASSVNTERQGVVRLAGSGELAGALPRLLGFHPRNSLVVVCLHGPRRQVGLVMRFDLVGTDGAGRLAEVVAGRVGSEQPEAVAIAVFGDHPPDGVALPQTEIVEALDAVALPPILDTLLVVEDRWWSYRCTSESCCGVDGNRVDLTSPGATALAAACVLAGHGVLPDRSAVAGSIAVSPAVAGSMGDLISQVRGDRGAGRSGDGESPIGALLDRLKTAAEDPQRKLAAADVADLAVRCHHIGSRDEVLLGAGSPECRNRLLRMMVEVVREVPPPHDAPVCTVLAWLAYSAGDGVLAGAALDRALSTDPSYSLARLLARALDQQVHPTVLEQVVRTCGVH